VRKEGRNKHKQLGILIFLTNAEKTENRKTERQEDRKTERQLGILIFLTNAEKGKEMKNKKNKKIKE
jgi:hypothetical protein